MKTQLMQDIQESAPASAPLRRRIAPHGEAGRALPEAAPPTQLRETVSEAPFHADPALPGWLVERLREDAEQADRAERGSRRRRHALAWSAAAVAVAALAGGAWWLHEENRVDGALGLVANTTPGTAAYAPAVTARPTVGAAVQEAPVREQRQDAVPTALPGPASGVAGDAAPDNAASPAAGLDSAGTVIGAAAPARRVTAIARPAAAAEPAPDAKTASRRREEILMQCSAHGYDARQCARHACTMTRYGFACRG